MLDLSPVDWTMVTIAAMLVGITKTGIPGIGILIVPMLAMVLGAKASVGFLLPMLCVADILAVLYWRRHANWAKLIKLIPWAFVGLLVGYGCHRFLFNGQKAVFLEPVIGVIVVVMVGMTIWRQRKPDLEQKIPTQWWFAALMGLLAGTTTMLANAAGPVMAIYLIAMKCDKEEFLGTGAWYFWLLNLVKIPFMAQLDMITTASALTNLALVPAIIVGGVLGIVLAHRIPNKLFQTVVLILAAIAGLVQIIRGSYELTQPPEDTSQTVAVRLSNDTHHIHAGRPPQERSASHIESPCFHADISFILLDASQTKR